MNRLNEELVLCEKLTTEMSFLGMKQYIDKLTRVTKDSKTLIDLTFANK